MVINADFNGRDNGTAYFWDRTEWVTNETFADWMENKEYLNSTVKIPTPRALRRNEL